jgi:hypothetical protein
MLPKKCIGFFAEYLKKPDGKQVEETIYETVKTKLALAIFTGLMLHYLFTYSAETSLFSQIGNKTVHLSINLNTFDNFFAISLKAAVHVVEFDTCHPTGCGIVYL